MKVELSNKESLKKAIKSKSVKKVKRHFHNVVCLKSIPVIETDDMDEVMKQMSEAAKAHISSLKGMNVYVDTETGSPRFIERHDRSRIVHLNGDTVPFVKCTSLNEKQRKTLEFLSKEYDAMIVIDS